jgi:uncharacterized protein YndB with AHSA1/START domain
MIAQTHQFIGVSPETLYNAYLSSKDHSVMTNDGNTLVTYRRPGVGEVATGETGDELHAFGFTDEKGNFQDNVTGTLLRLVPGQLIVMSWKNLPWQWATDPQNTTDFESTLVLTFKKTAFGAEIQMIQVNIPDYEVHLPMTGETGPLSSIVNTHWGILYWEPMKKYFAGKK